MQEKAIAELELERLFRDQKVERELLSRDINQHYARLYREGTLDMGFTTQVLLMHSARYQDAQRTDQLRGDLNAERDQRLMRALHDMEQRHASEIAIVKSGARKRTKIAEDKRRSECEAHNTSVLTHATSRIEATKAAKEKELLMREKEAAEMDMAVRAAVKEAVELKAKVARDFELAHKGKITINSAGSSRLATPATRSSRVATPEAGRGRKDTVTVDEAEAAELARLQQTLDLERAQVLLMCCYCVANVLLTTTDPGSRASADPAQNRAGVAAGGESAAAARAGGGESAAAARAGGGVPQF